MARGFELWRIWFLALAIFIVQTNQQNVTIQRKKIQNSNPGQSIDLFTNKDFNRKKSFCDNLNATCSSSESCKTCKCRNSLSWLNFSEGCKTKNYIESIANGENCFTYDKTWIPTIAHNETNEDVFITMSNTGSNLPQDIGTSKYQCQLESIVDISNGSVVLLGNLKDKISVITNSSSKIIKFPKDLDWRNSTGRVLSLNLKCANGTTSFPACFIFKVSGILIIEVKPTQSTKPKPDPSKDDDDVMDIVKPVVIVGCIFIVFAGVLIYCFCKRRQFLREQKERKISTAQSQDRRSVVTMSGWMNHAARSAAKMSTVSVMSEDFMYNSRKESIAENKYMEGNGGYEPETGFQPPSTIIENHNSVDDIENDLKTKLNNNNNVYNNNTDKETNGDKVQNTVSENEPSNVSNDSMLEVTDESQNAPESHNKTPDSKNTVISIDQDNIDPNTSAIGEPLGNSTRTVEEDDQNSEKDEQSNEEIDHSPDSYKNPAFADISGTSLPSLSGSLPANVMNDDFFDQMMDEYDKINTLPRINGDMS